MKKIMRIAIILLAVGLVTAGVAYALGARPADVSGIGWRVPFLNIGGWGLGSYSQWDSAYAADGDYSVDAQGVSGIDIKWAQGSVHVVAGDESAVTFQELDDKGNAVNKKQSLQYNVENGLLSVECSRSGGAGERIEKSLELRLPRQLAAQLRTFNVESASASLDVADLKVDEFQYNGVSGDLRAEDITADSAELSSTSGQISFAGSSQTLTADSVSGAIEVTCATAANTVHLGTTSGDIEFAGDCAELEFSSVSGAASMTEGTVGSLNADSTSGEIRVRGSVAAPRVSTVSGAVELALSGDVQKLAVGTTSGGVRLLLAQESAFVLNYESTSGELDCGFPVLMGADGSYTVNGGGAEFAIHTVSGDLEIKPLEE